MTLDFGEGEFCYLTTTGRVSGASHTIEIWFAAEGTSIYLVSGGADRSDWVKNLLALSGATVRVYDQVVQVTARSGFREPANERSRAISLLYAKYGSQIDGSFESWLDDAYIVALDLVTP